MSDSESQKETVSKLIDLGDVEISLVEKESTSESRNSDGRTTCKTAPSPPKPRDRKLTEKGKVYLIDTLNQKRQNAARNLSKEIKATYHSISDVTVDLRALEAQRDRLDLLKEELDQAHFCLHSKIEEDEQKQAAYSWFDVRDLEYNQCRIKLAEKIRSLEERHILDNRSSYSRSSKRSDNTSRSSGSARCLLMQAAAKEARIKAEIENLEREKQARALELEREISIVKAENLAMKMVIDDQNALCDDVTQFVKDGFQLPEEKTERDYEHRTNNRQAHKPIPTPRIKREIPDPTEQERNYNSIGSETLKQIVSLQTKQTELSALLINQQTISHLPTKEPPTFDGNPFDYPGFVTAFDTIISTKVTSDMDRLYYLEKYTKGKANDVIKGFLSLTSENSYKEARKLLDERFGNPIHVAEAYKSRMRNWPNIPDGNSNALQEFADFLTRCTEAVRIVGSLAELDSTQTLIRLSAKLPSYCGTKWCRHAYDIQSKLQRVSFTDFVRYVKAEAELANDPIFSPDALRRERKRNADRESRPKQRRELPSRPLSSSFATTTSSSQQRSTSSCPACDKGHSLERCESFKGMSEVEKRNVIISKALCFGCLKPGHLSSSCKNRLPCDECGKPHPTPLHGVKPKPKPRPRRKVNNIAATTTENDSSEPAGEEANTNANVCDPTPVSEGTTTSLIVPIVLSHSSNPGVEVKVYALLDDGSDSTFVKTSILKQLEVDGPEITLRLNTMHGKQDIPVKKIEGLIAKPFDNNGSAIELPKAYTRESIPSSTNQIATPESADNWPHLKAIKHHLLPLQRNMEVGVLIGCNCPKALKPRDVILGGEDDPYAIKTLLGWGVLGPATPELQHTLKDDTFTCHHVVTTANASSRRSVKFATKPQTKEILNACDIRAMFELDFCEREQTSVSLSQEDRKFLNIVENGINYLPDGHYEMPLPTKDDKFVLPNNRSMAYVRLKSLKKRFAADELYRSRYIEFMNSMLDKGYAELAPETNESNSQKVWYISHHGVYHPKKPDKLRVVFDCSACYEGESLNNHLLQGPDLTNSLTGVLYRFRQETVAIMCDIEAMFYQVKVPESCRDLLRFLWWENGDTSREPKEYRMTVHLFGATSSPGCANFALKTTADDNEGSLGTEAAEFVRRNFYVDDGLKSVPSVDKAFELVSDVKEMCKRGGFNLHKFTSNSKALLEKIPESDRAKDVKDLELNQKTMERALGVQWCTKSDAFKFVISLKDRPSTRRGILSTVSSIYDPLGFLAPVVLEGKSLLQDLCRLDIGWDDPIPDDMVDRWRKWRSQLPHLESFTIPRCYKPEDFGEVIKAELHHFSDASFKGYSQCSYLRLVNNSGRVHCSFLAGKARVTPLKKLTVPRLELTAAVVSVRVSEQLRRELDIEITKEVFWTDSKVVLGYIANAVRRFHIFVANRVQEIQDKSSVDQWMYVDTKNNPADEGSRGLRADQLKDSKWLSGPAFLWKTDEEQEAPTSQPYDLQENDPEIKKSASVATTSTELAKSVTTLEDDAQRHSSWFRVKRVMALCIKFIQRLRNAVKGRQSDIKPTEVNVSDLEVTEIQIIKAVQANHFNDEITQLKSSKDAQDSKQSNSQGPLRKLDPFIDSHGLLRVGGRLRHSSLTDKVKFPVILPGRSHVTTLIVRHFHNQVKHQGRNLTLSEIRANGYWVVGGSRIVATAIENCVMCNRLRAKVQEQKMADLPEDRLEPAPPFTNCAVDYFGPFIIKEKRKEMKRYGVLFTCLASRAVHLEVANTLETDSFINAFRRFVSRRGPVRMLRCDQGTNFVGARRKLAAALAEMDQSKVKEQLMKNNCDWFTFKMNVPAASHMGGVWERQIRTVRNVLSAILQANSEQLNDESLRTFMCEVEAIVNCRPLTVDNLNDPDSLEPLSPSQLLTMKTKVLMAPPGVYQPADQYSRKWWRRVQHLANEFWSRWRKEFLLSLQTRQKWTRPRHEMQVNDIVIIKDENLPRSSWLLGRVMCVNRSHDGRVRSAKVSLAERDRDSKGKRISQPRCLERPVQKLVVLLKQDCN